MLNPRAIETFKARKLNDYRDIKQLSEAELDQSAEQLVAQPPLWQSLTKLQKACLILAAETQRFAFFNDTGTGKTLLALALIAYAKTTGAVPFLVLVPRRANKYEWVREIEKHAGGLLTYTVLHGSTTQKWQQLQDSNADIIIETYAGLSRMMCPLTSVKRKKQGESVQLNKLVPDRKSVAYFCDRMAGAVLDESHNCQNPKALPYRLLRKVSLAVDWFFVLTATPFGKDPSSLWAQMFLVDHGETLGPTLGLFRGALFTGKPGYFGGMQWTFPKKSEPLLTRMLANRSITYEADEADLPAVVEIVKTVTAPLATQEFIDAARKTLQEARGNYQETKNAFLRMRQLSSGYIGFTNDESGSKVKVTFPYNPKLELLLTLIEGVHLRDKVIVFHEYNASGDRMANELKALKIGHLRLYGGTKTPIPDLLHRFDNDDKVRVLLLNNSMAEGLNLQVARYGIYYESPVSPIIRKQTRRRFERQHSKHKTVFLYDLVMVGTYDSAILASLKAGEDLFQSIMRGRQLTGSGRSRVQG